LLRSWRVEGEGEGLIAGGDFAFELSILNEAQEAAHGGAGRDAEREQVPAGKERGGAELFRGEFGELFAAEFVVAEAAVRGKAVETMEFEEFGE
jgi:hypothetical protein